MTEYYEIIELPSDEPVKFVGCYVLEWKNYAEGHPTVGFKKSEKNPDEILNNAIRILSGNCPIHNSKDQWEKRLRADFECPVCLKEQLELFIKASEKILSWDPRCFLNPSDELQWFLDAQLILHKVFDQIRDIGIAKKEYDNEGIQPTEECDLI